MFRRADEASKVRPSRLILNPLLCQGHGICTLMAADLLALDSWGYPAVLVEVINGKELFAAQRAVRSCPVGALHLEPINT